MRTKLSLMLRLHVEVSTPTKAKTKISKYLFFGKIVKVLFDLIEAAGKLCKKIGPNR